MTLVHLDEAVGRRGPPRGRVGVELNRALRLAESHSGGFAEPFCRVADFARRGKPAILTLIAPVFRLGVQRLVDFLRARGLFDALGVP